MQKILDEVDQVIMLLVGMGGDQCNYLAKVLNFSMPAITQRVQRLSQLGYVTSEDVVRAYSHRSYQLTEQGHQLLYHSRVYMNLLNLKQVYDTRK